MELESWLRSLGLEQYEAAFRENSIDEKVLTRLTADDLKELGVAAVGHRRTLLDAIAALRASTELRPETETHADSPPVKALGTARPSPIDSAERRQVTVVFADLVGSTALSAPHGPGRPAQGHCGLSQMRRRDRAPLRRVRLAIFGRRCAGLFWLSTGP